MLTHLTPVGKLGNRPVSVDCDDGMPDVAEMDYGRAGSLAQFRDAAGLRPFAWEEPGRSGAEETDGAQPGTATTPGNIRHERGYDYDPATGRLERIVMGDSAARAEARLGHHAASDLRHTVRFHAGSPGHSGIAIDNEYYDFGSTDGRGSAGIQWYDDPNDWKGIRSPEDIDLDDVIADITDPKKPGRLTGADNNDVITVSWCVCNSNAEKIEKWWKDL